MDPAGNSCGEGCLEYLSGTSVTITAFADPDWYFAGWRDGACAGWKTEPCSLTLNGGVTVQPHFDQIVE